VFHDLVGLTIGHTPKFARQYVNLAAEISRAAEAFCNDVGAGCFPSDAESFHSPAELREHLLARQRV
jgi:3-methyl-2-oxobutanoate hydroxymethyltransferase